MKQEPELRVLRFFCRRTEASAVLNGVERMSSRQKWDDLAPKLPCLELKAQAISGDQKMHRIAGKAGSWGFCQNDTSLVPAIKNYLHQV